MYLSIGQIILLIIVFFLFFGNFEKLNEFFIKLKSTISKKTEKKNKDKNLEE